MTDHIQLDQNEARSAARSEALEHEFLELIECNVIAVDFRAHYRPFPGVQHEGRERFGIEVSAYRPFGLSVPDALFDRAAPLRQYAGQALADGGTLIGHFNGEITDHAA